MRNRIANIVSIVMVLALALPLIVGCGAPKEKLTIYHAGSLAVPFSDLKAAFESTHPNVEVLCESGGSAKMINKAITVAEAGETPPDIIASADYTLIPSRLYEDDYADWYIAFARNKMVLCYCDGAPYVDGIQHRWEPPYNEEMAGGNRTWYDVLRNEDVSYGHSSPDGDPCGYRTPMVIQLAQKYYYDNATEFGLTSDPNADGLYDALIPGSEHDRGRVGGSNNPARPGGSKEVVKPKSVDLISSIQSGDLNYAFEYRSVAVQHNLNFIELNDTINLSQTGKIGGTNITYEDFYKGASIEIEKKPDVYETKKGKPIVYGITILENAQNKELAAEFVALLLSEEAQNVMETNGQPFLDPLLCDHPENLPTTLKELL
jgi:molybdate/tungstate transport system substrate-binding protein